MTKIKTTLRSDRQVRTQLVPKLQTVEKEILSADLGGHLMLVKVGEVLKLGEYVLCGGEGLWLIPFPLLSLLASCIGNE